jgi:hypothetical protein
MMTMCSRYVPIDAIRYYHQYELKSSLLFVQANHLAIVDHLVSLFSLGMCPLQSVSGTEDRDPDFSTPYDIIKDSNAPYNKKLVSF